MVGAGEGLVVHGRLLLLGLLYLGGQLSVVGFLRPLHAIDGTVETAGREAGFGLGFGLEGHISDKELDGQLERSPYQGNDQVAMADQAAS